jgi:hypothetical protein
MNARYGWVPAIVGTLLFAACSAPEVTSSAPATTPSGTATTTATSTVTSTTTSTAIKSGFCLDLPLFQAALLRYKASAGKAIEGAALDVETLKRGAAQVAQTGAAMQPSAPPEIAEQFRTVLAAVATSAGNLTKGATVRAIVDPLYGSQNKAAFDAVQNLREADCGT